MQEAKINQGLSRNEEPEAVAFLALVQAEILSQMDAEKIATEADAKTQKNRSLKVMPRHYAVYTKWRSQD